MAVIGERIRFLRKNLSLSQKELAKICNVATSTIAQYENNIIQPSDEVKKLMASYFNVTMDFLSGYSDYPNNKYVIKDVELVKIPIRDLINNTYSYIYVSSTNAKEGSFFFAESPQDMISERIKKKDMLYIKEQTFLNDEGKVFLVQDYNSNFFIGRLFKRPNEFILINNSFPENFKLFNFDSLKIIGIIIEVTFKL